MRKLYEIQNDIDDLIMNSIDPETGEVNIDEAALAALQMERDQKIENVILYCTDLTADISKFKEEIDVLQDRANRMTKTRDGLMRYLSDALGGEKFSTARCEASFRKSESVECDDDFCKYAFGIGMYDFIMHTEIDKPNKQKIKAFLKNGGELEHCRIVEKQNLSIK